MIRRFKERGTEKLAKRAKSREKLLAKVEVIEKPAVSRFTDEDSVQGELQERK